VGKQWAVVLPAPRANLSDGSVVGLADISQIDWSTTVAVSRAGTHPTLFVHVSGGLVVLKTGQPGLIAELCSAELAHALDVPVPRCRMIVRGDREHSSMLDGIQRAVEEADSPCKRVVTKMASEPQVLLSQFILDDKPSRLHVSSVRQLGRLAVYDCVIWNTDRFTFLTASLVAFRADQKLGETFQHIINSQAEAQGISVQQALNAISGNMENWLVRGDGVVFGIDQGVRPTTGTHEQRLHALVEDLTHKGKEAQIVQCIIKQLGGHGVRIPENSAEVLHGAVTEMVERLGAMQLADIEQIRDRMQMHVSAELQPDWREKVAGWLDVDAVYARICVLTSRVSATTGQ